MPESPALRARGLVKRYGDTLAVDGVDLEVARGACLGLLGPNGAGKTTSIEMLEGLRAPDAGEVEVLGMGWRADGQRIRAAIGVQLQETRLPPKLTVDEVLRAFRALYRESRTVDEVLALIGLEDKRGDRVENLSGGQHQRLSLGCALVNRPQMLFLDEPTTGLDPQARRRVWEIVEGFKREGGSVLLTTHYMDEAERLADDLAIVDHGRVIARGSPAAVIADLAAAGIVEFGLVGRDGAEAGDGEELAAALAALPGVQHAERVAGRWSLRVSGLDDALPALVETARERGLALADLGTHKPTLEDVFVTLTGRQLRDG